MNTIHIKDRAGTTIGTITPIPVPELDWDTGAVTGHTTHYDAHLTNGTPAGKWDSIRMNVAPATNRYPTEAKARAGIRTLLRKLRAHNEQFAPTRN